jgi:hypothetical protein
MNATLKTLLRISLVFFSLFLLYKLAMKYSPTSHIHAERYELNYPEEKVIEAITHLKNSDYDMVVPKITTQDSTRWNLNDGREENAEHHKFYFYDKANNRILFAWTASSGPSTTTFAFVSVNEGVDKQNWKDVNDDYMFFENRKIVNNFEETILSKLKKKLAGI